MRTIQRIERLEAALELGSQYPRRVLVLMLLSLEAGAPLSDEEELIMLSLENNPSFDSWREDVAA